ncbi:MAG: N-acyl homoserine lactone hydrolase [Thermoleophilaceae bacterium]|jgi:glyoxylase-like metal-dependent hydrolase (beta-lactamase superfamily II)|nr:N-acyl homoserine lactone hydrolase [Thermoleophilaceae bacterium]
MGTVADVRPATLPLADGRQGAAVRLHPLMTGTCMSPPGMADSQGRLKNLGIGVPKEEWIRVPFVTFLVEHPVIGPIMIDTGMHPSVAVDPRGNLGWAGPLVFKDLELDTRDAAPAQLRARGIEPASVKFVLLTHMHLDHVSATSEFAGATFVVSDLEWEAANAWNGVLDGYVKKQFNHAIDFRLLDFTSDATDSFATFGRGIDLFGDGSIHAVATPGHSAGHVSYVLRLEGGEALVAGDALTTMQTLHGDATPWRAHDMHNFKRSVREIQLYEKETPGAVIIPGHDFEFFQALKPVY